MRFLNNGTISLPVFRQAVAGLSSKHSMVTEA